MNTETKWKWAFIIFLILGLILALYLSTKPRYFNTYEFSKDNYVTNRASRDYLDTIVQVGLDELGIARNSVMIKDQPESKNLGNGYETLAYIVFSNDQSIIYVHRSIGRYKAIEVLSHELIHLEQYHQKRLVILDSVYAEWEGLRVEPKKIPYSLRPWEIEAFENSMELETKIKKHLYEN